MATPPGQVTGKTPLDKLRAAVDATTAAQLAALQAAQAHYAQNAPAPAPAGPPPKGAARG